MAAFVASAPPSSAAGSVNRPFGRVLVAFALGSALFSPATPAAAASHDGACGQDEGVTVVVAGGSHPATAVRCALGRPESGLAATKAAGFSYEFVPDQIGFVCRIDGYPNPCNGAPADAYWSLWIGDGRSWSYSTVGAATLRTPVGSAIAWSFGEGDPPPIAVPRPAASSPVPASPSSPPSSLPSSPPSSPASTPPNSPAGPSPTLGASRPPSAAPATPTTESRDTPGADSDQSRTSVSSSPAVTQAPADADRPSPSTTPAADPSSQVTAADQSGPLEGPRATAFAVVLVAAASTASFLAARGRRRRG
ncbi:MAG: hypothetical protein LBD97_03215 [Bifidobacteriaceae bacterium]|nr:hypothetical protein [Bifidobacteriaceae bacterium]